LVGNTWRTKVVANDHTHWRAQGLFAYLFIAAPMVGASSRQHLSEATGGGRRTRQRGGLSHKRQMVTTGEWLGATEAGLKKLESDPNKTGSEKKNGPKAVFLRGKKLQRFL
jgi:hypothetical protein